MLRPAQVRQGVPSATESFAQRLSGSIQFSGWYWTLSLQSRLAAASLLAPQIEGLVRSADEVSG